MAWVQVYDPLGSPWLSTLAAALPIVILLFTLGVLEWRAHIAALTGLLSALAVSIAIFGMPVSTALATALADPSLLGSPARMVAAEVPVAPPATTSSLPRILATAVAIALVLGTLYWRRFPAEGALRSYGLVAALVAFVGGMFALMGWVAGSLPQKFSMVPPVFRNRRRRGRSS